jgi:serine/threonine-protein kinase
MEAQERLKAALADRYAIEKEIGSGGMATVYLADDLRHERKVALKVLKPELAAVVGAERFLAEIKTTANLQHPNILPLFDSGEADSFLFYVMPFVEGETLRERLGREKQLPVDEAVRIASEVADALESAHEQGVIHRDIKPENILLSRGRPLVADFGIALAVSAAGGGRLTETGLSLGTPYYMSPEQASADRDPSAASDVYSLACVLYEMLVGEPPYSGATAQAVLAKILVGDAPAPTEARASIPLHVDAVIRKSLEKLPADRFPSAAAFAAALGDTGFRHGEPETAAAPRPSKGIATLAPWLLAGFAVAASIAIWTGSRSPEAPSLSTSIFLPDSVVIPFRSLAPLGVPRKAMAVSADGAVLVYVGYDGTDTRLYLRDLARFEHIPIVGTEGAMHPFFSPDGEWIGYFSGTRLWRVSVRGGQPEFLAEAPNAAGGFWTDEGEIVFAAFEGQAVGAVEVATRETRPITSGELQGQVYFQTPSPVPGGNAILAMTRFPAMVGVIDIASGLPENLLQGFSPTYLPSGHLVFARGGTLYAVGFDPAALEPVGEPVPIRTGVHLEMPVAHYTVSPDGSLFYVPGVNSDEGYLTWVDRAERVDTINATPAEFGRVLVSPNGELIVAQTFVGGTEGIYVLDPNSGRGERIVEAPGLGPAIWTHDGSAILYSRASPATLDPNLVVRRPLTGSTEDTLYKHTTDARVTAVTEDESLILFNSVGQGVWALTPDGTAERILTNAEGPWGAELSPNGRWIAYTSVQTGQYQVYVEPFPENGEQHHISVHDNSEEPLWAADGSEIYYRNGSRWWAVPVQLEPEFSYGDPELIIEGPYLNVGGRSYDLHPDGERFLLIDVPRVESGDRIHVVTNWVAEMARQVPSGLGGGG